MGNKILFYGVPHRISTNIDFTVHLMSSMPVLWFFFFFETCIDNRNKISSIVMRRKIRNGRKKQQIDKGAIGRWQSVNNFNKNSSTQNREPENKKKNVIKMRSKWFV